MEDYGTKYRFTFDSVHGVEYKILIQKYGYTGDIIDRNLGRAPVIKRKKNGPICGTSLELYAECAVDGEFAEFFSAGPRDYYVEVRRGYYQVWEGFITPELYSEPSIAPPYDVEIVATDGLGELKLHDFPAMGLNTIRKLLCSILEWAMPDPYISVISQLAVYVEDAQDFLELKVNMDFMVGKTYYDVLRRLLDSFHMVITKTGLDWILMRETDAVVNSAGTITGVIRANSVSSYITTITGCSKTAGQMGVADMWPVGYLSTKIEPAKRSVVIRMPWQPANVLSNPDMTADTAWTKDNASFNSYSKGGYWLGQGVVGYPTGMIYQWYNVNNMLTAMKAKARVFCYSDIQALARIACYLQFVPDGGGQYQYCYGSAWTTTPPTESSLPFKTPSYDGFYLQASKNAANEYEWDFPPIQGGNTSGQLCIVFRGDAVVLYGAEFKLAPYQKGYEDTIKIDNGARGDGDDVEIIGGRFQNNSVFSADAYQGVFVKGTGVAYAFLDRLFSNKDFLSITALGYAESIALPRFRTTGKLDIPASFQDIPLLIRTTQGGTDIDSWIETYEWDLLNDELTISALSLPVAVLDVESETVKEMN